MDNSVLLNLRNFCLFHPACMVFTIHQPLIKQQNPECECSASVAKWIFQKKNVSVPPWNKIVFSCGQQFLTSVR